MGGILGAVLVDWMGKLGGPLKGVTFLAQYG